MLPGRRGHPSTARSGCSLHWTDQLRSGAYPRDGKGRGRCRDLLHRTLWYRRTGRGRADVLAALGGKEGELALYGLGIDPERVRGEEIRLVVIDAVDIFCIIPSRAISAAAARPLVPGIYDSPAAYQIKGVPVRGQGGRVELVDREPGIACQQLCHLRVIDPDRYMPSCRCSPPGRRTR